MARSATASRFTAFEPHDMSLNDTFLQFAGYGTRQPETCIDGKNFTKLCKDCGLMDKKFTTTNADLVFSKCKSKGARKLNFPEFKKAVEQIAAKKGVSIAEVEEAVINSGGPKSLATKADYVKFHDDKSTYTGVYAKGGPTNVDGQKDLSSLADRTPANNRGVSMASNFNRAH